jgi:hypothetical protein
MIFPNHWSGFRNGLSQPLGGAPGSNSMAQCATTPLLSTYSTASLSAHRCSPSPVNFLPAVRCPKALAGPSGRGPPARLIVISPKEKTNAKVA